MVQAFMGKDYLSYHLVLHIHYNTLLDLGRVCLFVSNIYCILYYQGLVSHSLFSFFVSLYFLPWHSQAYHGLIIVMVNYNKNNDNLMQSHVFDQESWPNIVNVISFSFFV